MHGTSRGMAWQSKWGFLREGLGTCQELGRCGFVHRRGVQESWDSLILEYLCWYPQPSIWPFCHQRHGQHPISAGPDKNQKRACHWYILYSSETRISLTGALRESEQLTILAFLSYQEGIQFGSYLLRNVYPRSNRSGRWITQNSSQGCSRWSPRTLDLFAGRDIRWINFACKYRTCGNGKLWCVELVAERKQSNQFQVHTDGSGAWIYQWWFPRGLVTGKACRRSTT